jgi:hypothetical protein
VSGVSAVTATVVGAAAASALLSIVSEITVIQLDKVLAKTVWFFGYYWFFQIYN